MTTKAAKGTCLCGCVTLETKTMNTHVGVCHCNTCRTWNGGPFMATDCGTDLTLYGEEHVVAYQSSDWAERAFCKNCGTHLFYKLKTPLKYIVSSELFGERDLQFDHEIFIDEKPPYYAFANDTKKMTGAEVFAAFAPEKDGTLGT